MGHTAFGTQDAKAEKNVESWDNGQDAKTSRFGCRFKTYSGSDTNSFLAFSNSAPEATPDVRLLE